MQKNTWNKQTLFTLAGMLALLVGLAAFFYFEGLTGKPIYLFAIVSVAAMVAAIGAVYLYLLSKGKIQQTGPDFRSLFFLGLMFFIFGSPEYPTFYAIGLVFVVVALVNKKKWRPEIKWSAMSQAQRNFKIAALAILFLLVFGGFAMWYLGVNHQNRQPEGINTLPLTNSFRDGKYLGYIHSVDVLSLNILFDDTVWLTGAAGQEAAIEAGLCSAETRSDCLPNDFFIKNAQVRDEILPLDEATLMFMQTWKMEETGEVMEREIGLNDFAKLINDPALHWRTLPYNITIQNQKVTRIEEVYIP